MQTETLIDTKKKQKTPHHKKTAKIMSQNPPCDDCPLRNRCASHGLECDAFAIWVNVGELKVDKKRVNLRFIDDFDNDSAD